MTRPVASRSSTVCEHELVVLGAACGPDQELIDALLFLRRQRRLCLGFLQEADGLAVVAFLAGGLRLLRLVGQLLAPAAAVACAKASPGPASSVTPATDRASSIAAARRHGKSTSSTSSVSCSTGRRGRITVRDVRASHKSAIRAERAAARGRGLAAAWKAARASSPCRVQAARRRAADWRRRGARRRPSRCRVLIASAACA